MLRENRVSDCFWIAPTVWLIVFKFVAMSNSSLLFSIFMTPEREKDEENPFGMRWLGRDSYPWVYSFRCSVSFTGTVIDSDKSNRQPRRFLVQL